MWEKKNHACTQWKKASNMQCLEKDKHINDWMVLRQIGFNVTTQILSINPERCAPVWKTPFLSNIYIYKQNSKE